MNISWIIQLLKHYETSNELLLTMLSLQELFRDSFKVFLQKMKVLRTTHLVQLKTTGKNYKNR